MSSPVFQSYADLLKALAHPSRLEIVYLLRDQELCVGEIYSMLDLPQANASQHLMILRQAKIVEAHKAGKTVCYKLTHPNIFKACTLLRDFLIASNEEEPEFAKLKHSLAELLPTSEDPVCHMSVSSSHTHYQTNHKGKYYYFCASGCLSQFKKNPDKYLKE